MPTRSQQPASHQPASGPASGDTHGTDKEGIPCVTPDVMCPCCASATQRSAGGIALAPPPGWPACRWGIGARTQRFFFLRGRGPRRSDPIRSPGRGGPRRPIPLRFSISVPVAWSDSETDAEVRTPGDRFVLGWLVGWLAGLAVRAHTPHPALSCFSPAPPQSSPPAPPSVDPVHEARGSHPTRTGHETTSCTAFLGLFEQYCLFFKIKKRRGPCIFFQMRLTKRRKRAVFKP